MATTVFQINLRVAIFTVTFAIVKCPARADQEPCDGGTARRPGEDKLIAAATVTPSPYYEPEEATYIKHEAEVRNHIAIKRLKDETETMKSESTTTAAHCSVKEAAYVELGALLDAGEGSMVTMVAGESRLMAHRAVLAARSPVFAAMLCHDLQDYSRGEVAIPEVEGPVLRRLLAYLYTLEAPQLPDMASQLLAAADMFGLSDLKAECEVHVAAQLSVETAAATAVLAIRHSSSTLRQAAVAFIKAHLVQVVATQGWANAARYQPEDMTEVYRLLSELPVENSTAATADTQPSTEATSLRHTSHGLTPAAAASPSPSTSTPDDVVSHLRRLPSEEKGRRLREAAEEGRVEDVVALLAAGANVWARDSKYRRSALHHAAWEGHMEVARHLLQGGAEVDARDISQLTPLHYAAECGHTAVVRLLLTSSADPNARDRINEWTPLHWAVVDDHAEVVAALLQAGADRGAGSTAGYTPLDNARRYKNQSVIPLLT